MKYAIRRKADGRFYQKQRHKPKWTFNIAAATLYLSEKRGLYEAAIAWAFGEYPIKRERDEKLFEAVPVEVTVKAR